MTCPQCGGSKTREELLCSTCLAEVTQVFENEADRVTPRCVECKHMLRPRHTPVIPGKPTREHAGRSLCRACWQRLRRKNVLPVREVMRHDPDGLCSTCLVSFRKSAHFAKGLCRLCYRKNQMNKYRVGTTKLFMEEDLHCDRCQRLMRLERRSYKDGREAVVKAARGLCRTCYGIYKKSPEWATIKQIEVNE